ETWTVRIAIQLRRLQPMGHSMSEEFRYAVKFVDKTPHGGVHYEIAKFGDSAEPTDTYDVTIGPGDRLYCNCLGFRRQTYAKELHKHVLLVQKYREMGEPVGAMYKLEADGTPVY